MFANIKVSTRLLRIPISITGVLYAIFGFFALVSLFKPKPESYHIYSTLSSIFVLGLLAFVHFKAFQAVKVIDKLLLRSNTWSTLPNLLSATFLLLFSFVLIFVIINFISFLVFLGGAIIYLFLIVASLGTIYSQDWFGFHYFTHYVTGFWHFEHQLLGRLFPNGHDQTMVIFLFVGLVIFVIPTILSLFILGFRHLMPQDLDRVPET